MSSEKTPKTGARGGQQRPADRNARLKSALQANLARRKAQVRARASDPQASGSDAKTVQDKEQDS